MLHKTIFRLLLAALLIGGAWLVVGDLSSAAAQDKKDEPKEKKGKIMGTVVAKGKNSIKVKAFGEEKEREYFPKWIGGQPAQGGGLDKKMLATFAKLKVGQRVRLTWEWEERFRAVEVEILDKQDKDAPKEK